MLGRAADVWGYAPSYLLAAGISALAVPFLRSLAPPERPRRHPRADRHHIGAVCFNRMTRERRWSYVD